MKEKEIIRSDNKILIKKLKLIMIIFIVISLISILFFTWGDSYQRKAADYLDYCDILHKYDKNIDYDYCFEKTSTEKYPLWHFSETPRTIGLVGSFIFIPVTLAICLLYLMSYKTEIVVTDKRIFGKSLFGKRVDLPLDSISSISKIKLLKGITAATSSGKISFLLITNNEAIYEEISKLLIARQKNEKGENTSKYIDELKELKKLLDDKVITKEEFNKKKKELLDL